MFHKLLCLLNIHNYEYTLEYNKFQDFFFIEKKCLSCGKIKFIKGISIKNLKISGQ